MKPLINYIKRDKINSILLLISFVWFVIVMAIVGTNFFSRFAIELQEGFIDDGSLYCMVGKGIVNGLKPYVDYFETKGPMLFYFCALGYLISGSNSYYAVNVFSFICLLGISLLPIILLTIRFIKQKEKNYLNFFATIFAIFPFSFLLASFAEYYAGKVHAEIFCSFFLLIAFLILILKDGKKLKFYSPSIIISGLLLCCSTLCKETFAFIGVIGILFICRSKRDLVYKFILPFAYGVAFAFIFLLATNILVPYFSIYIKSMLTVWLPAKDLGYETTPFILEMIDIINILRSFWIYSPILTILLVGEFLLTGYLIFKELLFAQHELKASNLLICLFYCLSLIFITPFILALGDPKFPHQQANGIPIYYLLLFYLINQNIFSYRLSFKPKKYNHYLNLSGSVLAILSCLSICLLPTYDYEYYKLRYQKLTQTAREWSTYVDNVLDALNEERYQNIGGFLRNFYIYTKHLPYGPCFFQTDTMFSTEHNYLVDSFKAQIQMANVVVVTEMNCGIHSTWVLSYLNSYFSQEEPECIRNIPKPESFNITKMYYRVSRNTNTNMIL